MRAKTLRQRYLDFTFPLTGVRIVKQYREKYRAINELLLANSAILDLAHDDFRKWLSDSLGGRESRYTSEELLRTTLVMFVEQDSYRDVVVRIENSDFLRGFVGLGFAKPMMDFTFLSKAFAPLTDET